MALSGARDENPQVNHSLVQQDVDRLHAAGPGKMGTDEIGICGILLQRSDPHLRALAQAYQSKHRRTLSQAMASEFSGHMKDALIYIARYAEADGQGVQRDAEMIEESMSGMGTKDERLIWRIVRAHWNRARFEAVKQAYQGMYGKSMRKRVEGETTGKYEVSRKCRVDDSRARADHVHLTLPANARHFDRRLRATLLDREC